MFTKRIHKLIGIVLLVIAVAALGTGWVMANGEDVVYHACANVSNNGALHHVAADEPCAQNEIRLVWNQQGPAGLDGRPGLDGLHCWDLDGNGEGDIRPEDRNGDGPVDVLDCQVADSVWQADLAVEADKRSAKDAAILAQLKGLQTQIAILESTVEDQQTRLAELEDLLGHFSRDGDDISITGANLQVTNGEGTTESINGLGNIIIGYNELKAADNDRSGSHMLVLGAYNNYSSYGGIVAGKYNTTSGNFSSVTGGTSNEASGFASVVSGGSSNVTIGHASSVTGGHDNTANDDYSAISGGYSNFAGGKYSSISGGSQNSSEGEFSSVSGGSENTASGLSASVSGGYNNIASGDSSSVSGGRSNDADGGFSSVSGGYNHYTKGKYHWAAGSLFESS